jgi:hypothetical protein
MSAGALDRSVALPPDDGFSCPEHDLLVQWTRHIGTG